MWLGAPMDRSGVTPTGFYSISPVSFASRHPDLGLPVNTDLHGDSTMAALFVTGMDRCGVGGFRTYADLAIKKLAPRNQLANM